MIEFILGVFDLLMNAFSLGAWGRRQGKKSSGVRSVIVPNVRFHDPNSKE